jgi:putative nucleotidyltransferase with HDIG domain
MARFKQDTLDNICHYLELQKKQGLYIKISLFVGRDSCKVEVRNNSVITRAELIRISDRLTRSDQFKSIDEAFATVLDDSEGAGLGIVMMVMMLHKMGMSADNFDIEATDNETVARLSIPFDKALSEDISWMTGAIVSRVNSLPHFPENITRIQKVIDDPSLEMSAVVQAVSTDPALTADLIKTVNSAQYMLPKRVDNIAEAVKLMGLRGIKNLLYSYGSQKLLGDNSDAQARLWEHCNKTAFLAYAIVDKFVADKKAVIDDVYVGGMLHDMGKIIFSREHPALYEELLGFCRERNIPDITLEDLASGMNHAEIGALIAEKWDFPENLIAAIRYHHDPRSAKKHQTFVNIVYLANIFAMISENRADFEQIDTDILTDFGIEGRDKTLAIIRELNNQYVRLKGKAGTF